MNADKIILAGTLLSAASEPVLKDRFIRISGEFIESVEPLPAAPLETGDALVIDARDKVVIPGLVNAHCHHTEALQRSLRDRVPFELWLPVHPEAGHADVACRGPLAGPRLFRERKQRRHGAGGG